MNSYNNYEQNYEQYLKEEQLLKIKKNYEQL